MGSEREGPLGQHDKDSSMIGRGQRHDRERHAGTEGRNRQQEGGGGPVADSCSGGRWVPRWDKKRSLPLYTDSPQAKPHLAASLEPYGALAEVGAAAALNELGGQDAEGTCSGGRGGSNEIVKWQSRPAGTRPGAAKPKRHSFRPISGAPHPCMAHPARPSGRGSARSQPTPSHVPTTQPGDPAGPSRCPPPAPPSDPKPPA